MNENQSAENELGLDASVAQVMRALPPPLRAYLANGEHTKAAKIMMRKYGLRVDQAGVLERELMLLLMGLDSLEEFENVLMSEAALSEEMVRNMILDMNEQIFVPLREQIRKTDQAGPVAAPVRKSPPPPSYGAPRPQTPMTQQQPQARPTMPAPSIPPAMQTQAQPPRPLMPQPQARPVMPPPPATRPPAPPAAPMPNMGPMAAPRPVPPHVAPLPPKMAMPRPMAPGAMPPSPRPAPPAPPNLPGAPTQSIAEAPMRPASPSAPAHSYSVDPYREPLE